MQAEDPRRPAAASGECRGSRAAGKGWDGGPWSGEGKCFRGSSGKLGARETQAQTAFGRTPNQNRETLRAGPVVGQVAVGQPQREDSQAQE